MPSSEYELSIASLGKSWNRLLHQYFPWLVTISVFLSLLLLYSYPGRFSLYLVSAGLPLVILWSTIAKTNTALPVFPSYLILQSLSFSLPLFAPELVVDHGLFLSDELLASCILPLFFWFFALWLGWFLTSFRLGILQPRPPLFSTSFNFGYTPHKLLFASIILQLFLSSPLLWQLGGLVQALRNPLHTLISFLGTAGAFTGSFAFAQRRLSMRWLWLLLFFIPLFLSVKSLLISSLQTLLFAFLMGLWLGRARLALPLTFSILLLVWFLNLGKPAIRTLYWGENASRLPSPVVLVQQWTTLSFNALSSPEKSYNLFTDRFNNLQNLLFVNHQLLNGYPTIDGRSLSVIPQILLPRFLNTNRIGAHEGQHLLNLEFGRQSSLSQISQTYIAWGFLSESVANYGSFFGPFLLGLPVGFLLRLTENIGRGQLILSLPGMLSTVLAFLWISSYEMAASTFVASFFQLTLLVLTLGWLLQSFSDRSNRFS